MPEGQPKSALAPIRRPPYSAEAGRCRSATKAVFSFGPCNRAAVGGSAAYGCGIPLAGTARFLFGQDRKGAPAAPRAVGRGGARERAQFSPQAETELSGLCDDDNGGCIPAGQAPLREQPPPKGCHPLQNAQYPRRAAVLPPEAPAVPITPPSIPFPSWPADPPASCSCRPSASAGPSPPASDRPQ